MPFHRITIRGFTLVETLMAVLIASVLLGFGLPAFNDLQQRIARATTYHRLTAALMQARSTAVTTGMRIALCPSTDGRRCSDDLDWSEGWILYRDPFNTRQPGNIDDVLQVFDRLPARFTARSSEGRPRVRYLPDGRSSGSNLSIEICNGEGLRIGRVIVNNAGRARTESSSGPTRCAGSDART